MHKIKNILVAGAIIFLASACGGGSSTPPAATVSLTADASSVLVSNASNLTWSSTNATACSASWTAQTSTSGSEAVTISTAGNNTYVITCTGSGATGSASVIIESYRNTDGVVVDGYISGATIFIDEDNDWIADSNENSTTSDNDGKFTIKYANGYLVSIGGTDLDSLTLVDKLLIAQKLTGHSEFKTITPVTAVAAFMTDASNINAALGIDASIDVTSFDPVANKGDSGINDYLYEKGNQLTILAYSLQNLANNIKGSTETSQDFFKAIAQEIESEFATTITRVDIEGEAFISKVLKNVIAAKTLSMADADITMTSKALSGVLPIVEIKSSDALTTSVQRFGLSTFQNDIQAIANGSASPALIASYSSDTLNYIAADQSIDASSITPRITAISDSGSTTEDTSTQINVLPNDSYLSTSPIAVSASDGTQGTVSVSSNLITYTPATNFNGSDTFSYTITQGNQTSSANVTMTISPVQDSPSIDVASTIQVAENQTTVETISVSDPDATDTLTLSIGGTDVESFNLSSSNVLSFKEAADFETKNSYALTLSLTDGQATVTKDITVSVTNVNDIAPSISSSASFSVPENQAAITTITATDAESDSVSFTVSGSELQITSAGVLSFTSLPDYETKNSYAATVTATDGVNSANQNITVSVTNLAQGTVTQLGSTLTSDTWAFEDIAISGDGLTLAYSVQVADTVLNTVEIVKYDLSTWSQLGSTIVAEAGETGFGNSVAISDDGTIVAIGVTRSSGVGLVKVYKYSSGSWSQLGSDINGTDAGDYFGYATSLSNDGTILAVGAIMVNSGPGAASVYQYSSGAWSQLGSTINGVDTNDWFGRSVSLSGNGQIVAIGSDRHDSSKGEARIYEYASGSWSQLGSDIDGNSGDRLGRAVSLSDDGSIIALGSRFGGTTKVFQFASGSWSQLGSNMTSSNVFFGKAATISDDGAIATFSGPGDSSDYPGSFDTYKYSSNTWTSIASVPSAGVQNQFGWTSDTSNDGSIVAAGSYKVSEDSDNSLAKIYKVEIEN